MSLIKTRAKNFSNQEITTLVDLVLDNKSKLFGSFSSSLTFDDKNTIWEEIARTISQQHQTVRTKDDVSKKWCNIFGKQVADLQKPDFELKIKSIKGKETFEGITGGLDLSMESPASPFSACDMVISPPPFEIPSQSSASESELKATRKRKLTDQTFIEPDSIKQKIFEKEEEKINILRSIDFKLDKFAESYRANTDRIVDLLERLVSNQNKLLVSNTSSTIQPHSLPCFQASSSTHIPLGYQPNYFPQLPPFYPDKD